MFYLLRIITFDRFDGLRTFIFLFGYFLAFFFSFYYLLFYYILIYGEDYPEDAEDEDYVLTRELENEPQEDPYDDLYDDEFEEEIEIFDTDDEPYLHPQTHPRPASFDNLDSSFYEMSLDALLVDDLVVYDGSFFIFHNDDFKCLFDY